MNNGMTYKEILGMISGIADYYFFNSLKDDGMQKKLIECATKIYIAQMQLEKEKLQEEYDELYEGHDKLSYDWAQLKKENRELNKKYNELLDSSNRKSNEPVERRQTLADWLKEKEEEKNVKEL